MDSAFDYLKDNGIATEEDYPYEGRDMSCQASSKTAVTKVSKYVDVDSNENALAQALQGRVVSVAVNAEDWQSYNGGIVTAEDCDPYDLDHGVTLTAMGKDGDNLY